MSTLMRVLLALGFSFGVNLAVAQNAEWAEGKYPGHDREHAEGNQGQPAAAGSPQPDRGQSTDDQSQKDREQADQKSSAVRKQAAPEYPKNNN
jgi:hypothetical protein